MTRRRAKLVLLVLALAIVGLGVWAWEPVWQWATTTEKWRTRGSRRYWIRVSRWDGHIAERSLVEWHLSTGFKQREGHEAGWLTIWRRNGAVDYQVQFLPDDGSRQMQEDVDWEDPYDGLGVAQFNWGPVWHFDVTDQASPSDPQWIAEHGK